MRDMDRILYSVLLVLGFGFSPNTWSCSTDGWDNVFGSGVAGSPESVSRFSEHCAFEISDGSYTQSTRAANSHYIARFYVLDGLNGSGDVDILEAYSNDGATTALFKISLDGSQFTFDASDAGGGTGSMPSANGWNVVEIDWDSVGGTFKYWVNADAQTDAETGSVSAGAGIVEAINLGAPNGFGTQTGTLTFDAFESHNSLPVGQLLNCDAEGDQDIDINDVLAVVDEVFGVPSVLADGQPDCTSNGAVDINDALGIVDIVF